MDKTRKTITIYSKRQAILTTFSVPDEYFMLPADTWDNGDEVRIYYKEERQGGTLHEHHQDGYLQEIENRAGGSPGPSVGTGFLPCPLGTLGPPGERERSRRGGCEGLGVGEGIDWL